MLEPVVIVRPRRQRCRPIPVIATKVEQHDVPIILTGLGTVTALNTATVHSQITGLLISVDFREGQSVKKGDLLAQIDPRTYQAQLDQAQATLAHDQAHLKNAQLNLQRYSELVKDRRGYAQQRDNQQAAVEELDAQIKSDQAAIENAKAQLSYTRLVAPFDGVTGIRLLDVGNIIHPPTWLGGNAIEYSRHQRPGRGHPGSADQRDFYACDDQHAGGSSRHGEGPAASHRVQSGRQDPARCRQARWW